MPIAQPSVAVVILNWNGKDFLEKYLPFLYNTAYSNLAIYVADNGSNDNSIKFLASEGFEVFVGAVSPSTRAQAGIPRLIIKMPENYGFAEGYNVALRQIQADYYVLLNSDVEVSENWIAPVIELMEQDEQIAACQPKIRMERKGNRGLFEHAGAAGGWIDKWGYPFCRGRVFNELETDEGQYDDVQEVFWATGAAMFIRSNLYHAFGGLDSDFFAHMEEIDLCWRLKRANYKIMVCPQSVVWHLGGGTLPKSNPRKDYLNFRNSLTTVFKNEEGWRMYWVIWVRLILDGVAGLRFLAQGNLGSLWAIIRAHWAFFFALVSNFRKRSETRRIVQNHYYKTAKFNKVGRYEKSIVWQHFARKKKTFKELQTD